MAARRTRVTLSIPWDDENNDHPSAWGWDEIIMPGASGTLGDGGVMVVDFEEVDEKGHSVAV